MECDYGVQADADGLVRRLFPKSGTAKDDAPRLRSLPIQLSAKGESVFPYRVPDRGPASPESGESAPQSACQAL